MIREKNHPYSEKSKRQNSTRTSQQLCIGDLVYLYSERQKTKARDRYIIVSMEGEWCFIKKFVRSQLRSYKVKLLECYRIESEIKPVNVDCYQTSLDDGEEETPMEINTSVHDYDISVPPVLSVPLSEN